MSNKDIEIGVGAGLLIAAGIAENFHQRLEPPGDSAARMLAKQIGEKISQQIMLADRKAAIDALKKVGT